MIYIDPPTAIKFWFELAWHSTRSQGSKRWPGLRNGTREVEMIKAFRDTWELGIHSYSELSLRETRWFSRRISTESGSLFVQIGDENVHLVRALMDEVFGPGETYRSHSVSMPFGTRFIEQMADFLIWYGKDISRTKYRRLFQSSCGPLVMIASSFPMESGCPFPRLSGSSGQFPQVLDTGLRSRWSHLVRWRRGAMINDGKTFTHPKNGYGTDESGMRRLIAARRVVPAGRLLRYVLYADDKPFGDLTVPWSDTTGADIKTFVVQTNTLVVTGPVDVDRSWRSGARSDLRMLDDGSCAEKWGRRWITIDTSRVALALARRRMMGSRRPLLLLADWHEERRARPRSVSAEARSRRPVRRTASDGDSSHRGARHVALDRQEP